MSELALSWERPDASIRRILSDFPHIGPARYQLLGDKVFVLNKLVKLIAEQGASFNYDSIGKVIPHAIIDLKDAISNDYLKPECLTLSSIKINNGPSDLTIHAISRSDIDANIPIKFNSRDDAHEAIAQLMKGKSLPVKSGSNQVLLGGQVFKLNTPILIPEIEDTEYLTSLPDGCKTIDTSVQEKQFNYSLMQIPGIASADVIAQFSCVQNRIDNINVQIDEFFKKYPNMAWHGAINIDMAELNEIYNRPGQKAEESIESLEWLYPEMMDLSKSALSKIYSTYIGNEYEQEGYDVIRSADFLFFTLGLMLSRSGSDGAIKSMGKSMLYATIHGLDFHAAKEWAEKKYDQTNTLIETRRVLLKLKEIQNNPINPKNTEPTPFIKKIMLGMDKNREPSL